MNYREEAEKALKKAYEYAIADHHAAETFIDIARTWMNWSYNDENKPLVEGDDE